MNIPAQNINILWSYLIIEELIRHGIDYFCLSPGSRSTPLTTAVARHPQARKIMIYDERSAAFHALGYARATNKPAVLICTSGTAPANYLPAVIEAFQENLPLIVLSADRPPELRDSGANQTVDQIGLYGRYVRYFFDLPTPSETLSARFVLGRVDRLVQKALGPVAGPVHLNCMFREPLAPEEEALSPSYTKSLRNWYESKEPLTRIFPVTLSPNETMFPWLKKVVEQTEKGLIIVGGLENQVPKKELMLCLSRLGWPVFADITSGLRLGYDAPVFVPHFDLLLARIKPHFDTVIQLGGRFVSKRLLQLLQAQPPAIHIHVDPGDRRIDAAQTVTHRIRVQIDRFCEQLSRIPVSSSLHSQAKLLRQKSDATERLLKQKVDQGPVNQPGVSRLIARLLPPGHGLFLANSLAVREADMFAQRNEKPVFVAANRGASGIDGNISTASGFALGLQKPVTLLIGDLAFLHDLNALSFVPALSQPLIIVLINNGGGAIFHYLPVAKFDDMFEPYFATAHDLQFKHAALQFGLNYQSPATLEEFAQVYGQAVQNLSPVLIEIKTDRRANFALYQELLRAVPSAAE